MYKGIDIATAKVTDIEMEGVKHHLLSEIPIYDNFSVKKFMDISSDRVIN